MLLRDFDHMAIRCRNGKVEILDQRELPAKEVWLPVDNVEQMYEYISTLAVRGAPLIGCAAALALAVHAVSSWPNSSDIPQKAKYLRAARPTAVNLMFACDLIAQEGQRQKDFSPENICKLAYKLMDDEIEMYRRMSQYGATLINDGDNILTHCNTGSLATPGQGTALGVIREAVRQGKRIHVYVDETRPLLQGGRLTAYELQKDGIPYTIICDNMAATLMRQRRIQRIFVGADRIALNGDFANKIGTYSLAVVAKYHNVPFHTVAPVSSVDFDCQCGDDIPIEQRKREEVLGAFGTIWAPKDAAAYNPAFDVTPIELVDSIILDSGMYTREQVACGALKALKSLKSKPSDKNEEHFE
jgi:methylthioribose-1-phosphate isomerase